MHPIRFGLPGVAVLVAFSAVALAAAPTPTVPAGEQPAAHDHTHAVTGTAEKPDVPATTNMMQQMQAMHAKMMAAKTPAERAALMPEHMAMMQNGMSMMQNMQKPTAGDATSQRMDMMQMMMQMMMDRMSVPDAQKPDTTK